MDQRTATAVLVAAQGTAEALVIALDVWHTGGAGLVLPALAGAAAASGLGYRLRSVRPVSRSELRRLALGSAVAHVPGGAVAWAAANAVSSSPSELAGTAAWLGALAVGLLAGGTALMAATTALDLGVHLAGGLEPETERYRSFREPPG